MIDVRGWVRDADPDSKDFRRSGASGDFDEAAAEWESEEDESSEAVLSRVIGILGIAGLAALAAASAVLIAAAYAIRPLFV